MTTTNSRSEMNTCSALVELIKRLEFATQGNRKLDERIAYEVKWRPEGSVGEAFREYETKHGYQSSWDKHALLRQHWPIPPYTSSVDAALTLLPEDPFWRVGHDSEGLDPGNFKATIVPDGEPIIAASADTAPLALSAVALKALKIERAKSHNQN